MGTIQHALSGELAAMKRSFVQGMWHRSTFGPEEVWGRMEHQGAAGRKFKCRDVVATKPERLQFLSACCNNYLPNGLGRCLPQPTESLWFRPVPCVVVEQS